MKKALVAGQATLKDNRWPVTLNGDAGKRAEGSYHAGVRCADPAR
jgi:hypothetical protein